MEKRVILIFMAMAVTLSLSAQQERKFIRGGNGLFHSQDFEKAEVEYRKALDQTDDSYTAAFNLGDAMYKQQKFDEALQQFSTLTKDQIDKEQLGALYHNIGNTFLEQKKLDESIEAYKESLRNRPNSQETKYNLEYARKMKQQQENEDQNKDQDKNEDQNKDQDKNQDQNQDQNKDQDQNQDKNQDQNKDQDKNQDQNQDKDQQDKDKQDQNKDQQDQDKDQQQLKISPEDARRLLEALEDDEKKTQEQVQKNKMEALKSKRMKIEKNW